MQLKGNKKILRAWAFYDWANSVYSLVISSAIFPIYYGAIFRIAEIENVLVFGLNLPRASLISYATAIAFVIVALITPIISGIADYLGNKKVFLKSFCYLGAGSCIALYWFDLSHLEWGLLFYIGGLVGFWVSFAISNSYLPDIAYEHQQDKVSAWGFSMGYLGSVILLIVNLVMVLKPNWFAIQPTDSLPASVVGMKFSFITVGLWWLLFSQYTFAHLPKGFKKERKGHNLLWNGFLELKKVAQDLKYQTKLKRFLFAFFVYDMAVQSIMLIAAYFGEEEINWGTDEFRQSGLILSILIIQLIAIPGAMFTARISKNKGNINTLIGINCIWIALCIYAYFMKGAIDFFIGAALVGLIMGAVQALSRSTYSKLLPETKDTTSYFSFYDVAEKIAIVIGMIVFGLLAQQSGTLRYSTLFFAFLFLIGVILLFWVKKSPERSGL